MDSEVSQMNLLMNMEMDKSNFQTNNSQLIGDQEMNLNNDLFNQYDILEEHSI